MVAVTGLFEVHLTVSNLERSVAFYRDVVGLQLARVFENRRVAFFWIGPEREAMVGWATGDGPQRLSLPTAFRTTVEQVLAAPNLMRAAGVEPLDFDGTPTHQPVVLGWIPGAAVYFRDPDGHLLEYLAVLPGPVRPEVGVVPWRVNGSGCIRGVTARAEQRADALTNGLTAPGAMKGGQLFALTTCFDVHRGRHRWVTINADLLDW